ncbi:MAG: 50S ribosomal protein L23 [Blastocatellia bacterium]|jgi:large subunit ribosomal protein L23
MKTIWDVIKGPVITEKALTMKDEPEAMGRDGNDRQMLTLKVDRRATKPEIKRAIEQILGVKVDQVRVANYQGKMKRVANRREMGRRPDWKKAFVTLKAGEKPIMYEDAI